jgi:hypothetical protein
MAFNAEIMNRVRKKFEEKMERREKIELHMESNMNANRRRLSLVLV